MLKNRMRRRRVQHARHLKKRKLMANSKGSTRKKMKTGKPV